MYALYEVYRQKLGGIPNQGMAGVYSSSTFRSSLFKTSSTSLDFFGVARREVYGEHGYGWWLSTPEWMPFDDYNPKGFLEAISASGLAQGWTCDQDAPTKSIAVDLYVGTTKVTTVGWFAPRPPAKRRSRPSATAAPLTASGSSCRAGPEARPSPPTVSITPGSATHSCHVSSRAACRW